MKSHMGGTHSLGKGMIYSKSTQQKLNTWSSTEAELVTIGDCMSQVLWTCLFLCAQGYWTINTVVYQDNKSAMLLENNRQHLSSK